MRLSPLDPLGYIMRYGLAVAHFAAGQYEEAMNWVDRTLGEQPRLASAVRMKIVLCVLLHRLEEARKWAARLLDLHPTFTVTALVSFMKIFTAPEITTVFADALRKAGVPEK